MPQWTIDSISHALPHPDLRAGFMREVTFKSISDLPGTFDRWVSLIERFDAERPRVDELADYYRQHGQLPDEHEAESADGRALYENWKGREHQGAA